MATGSRSAYFDAAIGLLDERGPRALTMHELCRRVGLTTGSFYRHFVNWADFKESLLATWFEERTVAPFAESKRHADAHEAVLMLIDYACGLPHHAEAALRSWSLADPEVAAVQATIDRLRVDFTVEALRRLVVDDDVALRHAVMGQFVLIGFQQSKASDDVKMLRWSLLRVFDDLLAECGLAQGRDL